VLELINQNSRRSNSTALFQPLDRHFSYTKISLCPFYEQNHKPRDLRSVFPLPIFFFSVSTAPQICIRTISAIIRQSRPKIAGDFIVLSQATRLGPCHTFQLAQALTRSSHSVRCPPQFHQYGRHQVKQKDEAGRTKSSGAHRAMG
jgi:hypothetical protein